MFDILDRNLPVHQNTLLEASAGTGKTFSIEHLVVRLLITGESPPPLSRLLAVTFTRAATRDLKMRIRENIEKALSDLARGTSSFDYLNAIIERGEQKKAERLLESALYCFDQAQIFTIHGFCLRMLKDYGFLAKIRVDLPESENPLSPSEIAEFIKDYFRTDFHHYSVAQIEIVIKGQFDKFQKKLLHLINGKEIEKQPTAAESFALFVERIKKLKSEGFSGNDLHSKQKDQSAIERLKLIFERDPDKSDFDWLVTHLKGILKLKTRTPLLTRIEEEIYPLVHERAVLAQIAYECQQKFYRYLKQTEKYRFDDLLEMMKTALCQPQFKAAVRSQFFAAIIDEFQDTDPVQWDIFRDLFLHSGAYLYLVGDPKQSIYSFRQADIYTYLRAADDLGPNNTSSLNVNYRSSPSLIRSLNTLFSKPGFLALPKRNSYLPYREIAHSPKATDFPFKDQRGSVHFARHESDKFTLSAVEESAFFPFIVEEIQNLVEKENIAYSQVAILVADRFQAARLMAYLQKWKIPAANQRAKSLIETPAYGTMQGLIQAALHPKDISSVKLALGGAIFGWTHDRIREEENLPIDVMRFFYQQYQILINEGFGTFFRKLMSSSAEQILSREEGDELYRDLHQIAEILIESQTPPEQLLLKLEQFEELAEDEDPQVQKAFTSSANAVKLLTIHSSKGLEFDIVIPLGLIKRNSRSETFMPVERDGKTKLVPILDEKSEAYISYCEELNAEKMRQLYVALTRAKYRVYLPLALPFEEDIFDCSPMDLFMKHLSEIPQMGGITVSDLTGPFQLKEASIEDKAFELTPPETINLNFISKRIASFTSLAKPHTSEPILKVESPIKNPHTLPAGGHTGNMLHLLLEKLPSFQLNLKDIERFVASYVAQTPFQEWGQVLSEMLYSALITKLAGFSLNEIDPHNIYREMEFLYPEDGPYSHMKGFVDLIFQHEGLYYILDWKSNWLGPTNEEYQPHFLENAMRQHDYFLQAGIYTKALKKYLALVDERPFEAIFGGVIYVFIRGPGVYHVRTY